MVRESQRLEAQWNADALDGFDPARYVGYEVDEEQAVARITFSRPELANALPIPALEHVGDLVRAADTDDRVKTIVFRGEGEHFGTGADASELGHYIGYRPGGPRPAQRQRVLPDRNVIFGSFVRPIAESVKATICAVDGYCYGGHFQLALAADIVISTESATYTHPAFRYLGAAPQDFLAWFENLGVKRTKRLALTMGALSAEEGLEAGFISEIVKREELSEVVDEYVRAISLMPLDGIVMGKTMMNAAMEARGKGLGESLAVIAHGWATNLRFEEGEYNFLREREGKGLRQALADRDRMTSERFRLGR
jgi:enoyl-CoA hydratase